MSLALLLLANPTIAQSRATVEATAPTSQAVTIYRDPNRRTGERMDRDDPAGFAMISETRIVTLPPGVSTLRFTGVAEGMVAVSAIVTGLPGGTIEKNRNADLLSPAALVDGSLGNRVRITRTNPGTGAETVESAVIRTRADGGLVLQTDDGFEPVRCSGLPERLTFDRVPDGLSPEPVFTIDTQDDAGGTYTVTLSYFAWGFDWEANYVATVLDGGSAQDMRLKLVSWLTLLNDNGQSFEDAELLVVAGRLNVESDFDQLSDPPRARPLRLTCYPMGSTAAGSPIPDYQPAMPPSPAPPMMMRANAVAESAYADQDARIVVTGSMIAREEDLGDLKLYRVPEQVTISAQGLKQVAFLDRPAVRGRQLYEVRCADGYEGTGAARMLFATRNDAENGLGVAMPSGQIAFFEPSAAGELLVAEQSLRDYASGQEVEIPLGESSQVFAECTEVDWDYTDDETWQDLRASLTNANPTPVTMRLKLGRPSHYRITGQRTQLKDGERIVELTIPANGTRVLEWRAYEVD